jgi:hypothetical protein
MPFPVAAARGRILPSGWGLPYTFNPASLPDGAFPAPWVGSAGWTISGGKGICAPTLGVELLTDPGLEATYTDGLCDTLSKSGSPTVTQSADAHEGTKAQAFTSAASDDALSFAFSTAWVANTWYLGSAWGKRTAGTGGKTRPSLFVVNGSPQNFLWPKGFDSATYEKIQAAVRSQATASPQRIFLYPVYNLATSGYDTILVDDCSLKTITWASMVKLIDGATPNVIAKAQFTWNGKNGVAGVLARANAGTNPSNYLMAYYWHQAGYALVSLVKVVNGVETSLITDYTNSPGAGGGGLPTTSQWLEIRCSGTTVQLYQNNIQVGADQTVSDAEIISNTYHGVFQSGGNNLEVFFAGLN